LAVEAHGQQERRLAEQREALRHHADHGTRRSVHDELSAQDADVPTELALPKAVAEHHGAFRLGRVVIGREPSAEQRRHVQRVQRPVGHDDSADLLRLADAGHRRAAIRPEPDVLERFVFVAIGEIHAR